MRELTVSLFVLVLGAGLLSDDAEAARLGGGRSLGAQRQITTPPKQAAPPTQQPAPQPSGGSRWLAPLAGLAAGLGLGWLFAQGGFAEVVGALLMALLAAAAVATARRCRGGSGVPQSVRRRRPGGIRCRAFPERGEAQFRAPAGSQRPRRPRAASRSDDRRTVRRAQGRPCLAPGVPNRRGDAECRAAGARHRRRAALGERALLRLDPRTGGRTGRAVRRDLEPAEACGRFLGLAARRDTAAELTGSQGAPPKTP